MSSWLRNFSDRGGRPDGELVPLATAPLEWVKPNVDLRDQLPIRPALLLTAVGSGWIQKPLLDLIMAIDMLTAMSCQGLSTMRQQCQVWTLQPQWWPLPDLYTCFWQVYASGTITDNFGVEAQWNSKACLQHPLWILSLDSSSSSRPPGVCELH